MLRNAEKDGRAETPTEGWGESVKDGPSGVLLVLLSTKKWKYFCTGTTVLLGCDTWEQRGMLTNFKTYIVVNLRQT